MTNKNKTILFLTLAVIAALVVMVVAASGLNISGASVANVEVRDSKAVPEYGETTLTIEKSGTYTISVGWLKEGEIPGFVTGLIVTSEDGKEVFKIDGVSLSVDSKELELEAGKYVFRFTFLASAQAYESYIKTNYSDREAGDIDYGIFRDGQWFMDYSWKITRHRPYKEVGMVCGLLIGWLLVLLTDFFSSTKAKVRDYDERETAVQGKSYKYGFFTLIVYFILLIVAYSMDIDIPVENSLLVFIGIIIGVCVMATYSIMNDAYIHDENKKFYYIVFSIVTVIDSILGIICIVRGKCMENGILTFTGCCIVVSAVALIYILTVLLIKSIGERE